MFCSLLAWLQRSCANPPGWLWISVQQPVSIRGILRRESGLKAWALRHRMLCLWITHEQSLCTSHCPNSEAISPQRSYLPALCRSLQRIHEAVPHSTHKVSQTQIFADLIVLLLWQSHVSLTRPLFWLVLSHYLQIQKMNPRWCFQPLSSFLFVIVAFF